MGGCTSKEVTSNKKRMQDLPEKKEINLSFHKFCKFSPLVMKYVVLLFLTESETAKIAMVCKNSNKAIDSNKYQTDGPMEEHFQVVFKKKYNMKD